MKERGEKGRWSNVRKGKREKDGGRVFRGEDMKLCWTMQWERKGGEQRREEGR